jgi:hypothetical protein
MRDWQTLVEQRLGSLALEPEERTEVIAEVAAHLEDICEDMLRQGMTEEEAVRRALSQTGNWKDLRRKILAVKRKELIMQKRLRQLWIPGFLSLILCLLFQAALQKLGWQPRIVWSGPSSPILYMPWLAALPFFGALAAYVSSRAGGSRGTVLFVSVFPAFALTFAFLFMFPFSMAIELIAGRPVDFSHVATVLLKDGIGWLLVPGVALLAGGLLAQLLINTRSTSQRTAIG